MELTLSQVRELLGAKELQLAALQLENASLRQQLASERSGGAVATTSPRPLAFPPGSGTGTAAPRDDGRASVSAG